MNRERNEADSLNRRPWPFPSRPSGAPAGVMDSTPTIEPVARGFTLRLDIAVESALTIHSELSWIPHEAEPDPAVIPVTFS